MISSERPTASLTAAYRDSLREKGLALTVKILALCLRNTPTVEKATLTVDGRDIVFVCNGETLICEKNQQRENANENEASERTLKFVERLNALNVKDPSSLFLLQNIFDVGIVDSQIINNSNAILSGLTRLDKIITNCKETSLFLSCLKQLLMYLMYELLSLCEAGQVETTISEMACILGSIWLTS